MYQNLGKCTLDRAVTKNKEITVETGDPVAVDSPVCIESQSPCKTDSINRKETSVRNETFEKGFLAQKSSIERCSPPHSEHQVYIIINMLNLIKLILLYLYQKAIP